MNDKRNSNADQPLPAEDERVSAYLDGELTGAELAEFEQRMEADPACLAAVDEMRQVSGAMKSLPELKLGSDFSSRVMEQALAAGAKTTCGNAGLTAAKLDSSTSTSWRPYAYGLLTLAAATLLMLLVPEWNPFSGPNQVARTERNADVAEQAASPEAPATALGISGEVSTTGKSKSRLTDRSDFGDVADVKLQAQTYGLRYEESYGGGGAGMGGGAGAIADGSITSPSLSVLNDEVDSGEAADRLDFSVEPGAMGRPGPESVVSADAAADAADDLPLVEAPAAEPLAASKMNRRSVTDSNLFGSSAPAPLVDQDELQLATEAAQHREFIRGRMANELLGFAVPPATPQKSLAENEKQRGVTGDQVANGAAISTGRTPSSRPAVNQVVDGGVISEAAVAREMMERDIALRPVAVVSLPAEANLTVFFSAATQHGIRLDGVDRLALLAKDVSGDGSSLEFYDRQPDGDAKSKFDDSASVKNESDSETEEVADEALVGKLERMRPLAEEDVAAEESKSFGGKVDALFVDDQDRASFGRDSGGAVGFAFVFRNRDLAPSTPVTSRVIPKLAAPVVPPVEGDELMRLGRGKNSSRVSEFGLQELEDLRDGKNGKGSDPVGQVVKDESRNLHDLNVAEVAGLEKKFEKSKEVRGWDGPAEQMEKVVDPTPPADSMAASTSQPAVAAGQYVLVEAPPAVINQLVASLQTKAEKPAGSLRPLRTWYFEPNEQAVASAAPMSGGGIVSGATSLSSELAPDFAKPVQQQAAAVKAAAKQAGVRGGERPSEDRSQSRWESMVADNFSSRWLSISESDAQKVRVLFFIRSPASE